MLEELPILGVCQKDMHLFTRFHQFLPLLLTHFGFLVHSNGPTKPRHKESLRSALEHRGPVCRCAFVRVSGRCTLRLVMRLGVLGTRTRNQGKKKPRCGDAQRKMTTAKTSKTAHKPYQDSRNQMKNIAIPAAQQKSIRHRRISSGSRSGHFVQTPGGSNAKFWGQREHAGPSRPLLLHGKNDNGLAKHITFRKLTSSFHELESNARCIIAVNRHVPMYTFEQNNKR